MNNNKKPTTHLAMKSVSLMTGIGGHTLRAWENRYQAVRPNRNKNGRRSYCYQDVARLRLLKRLTQIGYLISKIAPLSEEDLAKLWENHQNTEQTNHRLNLTKPMDDAVRSILSFEVVEFHKIVKALRRQASTQHFVLNFASPISDLIETMTHTGQIDRAHERLLSSILRHELGNLLYMLQSTPTEPNENKRKLIIFSTPDNHFHEFGILACAILAELKKHQTIYLGPNLPASALGFACNATRPTVAVIDFICQVNSPHPNASFVKYLHEIHDRLPKTIEIWIGTSSNIIEPLNAIIQTLPQNSRKWQLMDSLEIFDQTLTSSSQD